MKKNDFPLVKFDPPFVEGCEIKCPQCEQFTSHLDFESIEVGCETCGEHDAMLCPKCEEATDLVHTDKLETRTTNFKLLYVNVGPEG